jgi:hypothetical protein
MEEEFKHDCIYNKIEKPMVITDEQLEFANDKLVEQLNKFSKANNALADAPQDDELNMVKFPDKIKVCGNCNNRDTIQCPMYSTLSMPSDTHEICSEFVNKRTANE